ncbi:MAG: hypothetical protein ACJAX5_002668 [Patiriisocius sp.]|jgi:hypothetical protein
MYWRQEPCTDTIANDDAQVSPQIGDAVSLTSGTSGVVVQFSDRFNQQLPAGITIAVAAGNGACTVANNPGTTQLSTNSTALNGVFLSLAAPVNPVTGSAPITITITTPQNVTSLFSFTCTY